MAKNVVQTVQALVAPVVEQMGLSLWDVEFVKEGARQILRVTIDSENGIGIDDCERVHRAIDPLLDEADPIETPYHLEVSSPGIERELRTSAHLAACRGAEVELRLFAPKNGKKTFQGILAGQDEAGNVLLDQNGTVTVFDRQTISKIRTIFHF